MTIGGEPEISAILVRDSATRLLVGLNELRTYTDSGVSSLIVKFLRVCEGSYEFQGRSYIHVFMIGMKMNGFAYCRSIIFIHVVFGRPSLEHKYVSIDRGLDRTSCGILLRTPLLIGSPQTYYTYLDPIF